MRAHPGPRVPLPRAPPAAKIQAALGLINGTDPTGGMESVTAEALASENASNRKDLINNLIQERDNLQDYIWKVLSAATFCSTRVFFFHVSFVVGFAFKKKK